MLAIAIIATTIVSLIILILFGAMVAGDFEEEKIVIYIFILILIYVIVAIWLLYAR